jgi:ABC-type branched-subunit amino acid transport system ATPase component
MTVLQVQDLGLRFGGLVAVRDLTFEVKRGEIFSIIGPNGAGKTTVFNAVTGIYSPSSGQILMEGRDMARTLGWRVRLACLAVGLLTGLAAMILSVDANALWRATVRHRMVIPPGQAELGSLSWGEVADDVAGYVRGDLAVEPSRRGWQVVSPHLNREVGSATTRAAAIELQQQLRRAMDDEASIAEIGRNPRWQTALDESRLADLRWARQFVGFALFAGFGVGFVLGVAGAYAVWRRSRRTPDVIARQGIARTFQNIRLFREMTVQENVQVGLDAAPLRRRSHAAGLQRKSEHRARRDGAGEILARFGLAGKSGALASSLSYGEQRKLEIARALAMDPDIILLDEPAAGMNPTETRQLADMICGIRGGGVTVLLIEHHMNMVMAISDRVVVLDHGQKIAEGTPGEVKNNATVIEAYLGREN